MIVRFLALAALLAWSAPAAVFVAQVAASLLPARRRRAAAPGADWAGGAGSVVLVPAHDEGPPVADTVAHLVPELGPRDRLVVVADNCADDTAAAARRGAIGPDGSPDPRVAVLERRDPARRGKGYALDFAVDHLVAEGARPAALFVLDADCRVSPGGVARLTGLCAATGRPAQARTLCEVDPATDPDAAGLMAVSELGLLFKNLVRPRGSARLGLPCQLMGTGMALPWDLLMAARRDPHQDGGVGGVFGGELAEDMQFGVDATLAGRSPIFLPDVRVTSPLPTSVTGFDGQRTRWEQGHLHTLTHGVPRLAKHAILKDDLRALGLAADLAVPPFSLLVLGWFAAAAALAALGWWGGWFVPLILHGLGGAALAAAVAAGWWRFGRDRVPAAALASVPRFVARKLPIYSRWFARKGETEWVRTERARERVAGSTAPDVPRPPPAEPRRPRPEGRPVSAAPPEIAPESVVDPAPVDLFGLKLDPVTLPGAVARVRGWVGGWNADGKPAGAAKVVVTPNVDHLVKLHRSNDPAMWAAYRAADLTTADGRPVVAAGGWFGKPLPARVPGSDLVPALLASATKHDPLTVFLLGAGPGVADAAAGNVARDHPHARVVGTHCPPLGFERDDAENAAILALLEEAKPDVLVVGLGFPKQEKWVHAHRGDLCCGAALCVGATIDFLAGNVRRAPDWVGKIGLEWTFRLVLEPRRLAGRYAADLVHFPRLLWREWRAGRR